MDPHIGPASGPPSGDATQRHGPRMEGSPLSPFPVAPGIPLPVELMVVLEKANHATRNFIVRAVDIFPPPHHAMATLSIVPTNPPVQANPRCRNALVYQHIPRFNGMEWETESLCLRGSHERVSACA
jgi:hypothetical protein